MLPFLPFLLVGVLLAATGWGGLAYLIYQTLPTLGPRWLFFFLLSLGVSGTALPVVFLLNNRMDAGVIVRESILIAVYVDLMVWLQLGRVLTPAMGLFLAIGLLLLELLLRVRERARFKPTEDAPDE